MRSSALLYAYDIVDRRIPAGPKGYLVDSVGWTRILYNQMRSFTRELETCGAYDALYEVIDADKVCLYLDVEVDRLKPGTGRISVDQLSLVARDARMWHSDLPDWYDKVAGVPWTDEEISIAHGLIVTWIRDFIENDEGWHVFMNRGRARPGVSSKTLCNGEEIELIVSQSHRQDGSKFSMHVVSPSLVFDKSTLGLKGFVCDLAVYMVYRMFKELGNDRCITNLLPERLSCKDSAVLRMMKLHAYGPIRERNNICRVGRVTPLDCVVYKTRGQLFRLVGMGKVKRGVLGDRLVLCRGDGKNPWDLEENGIGSRKQWMHSIVSHHSMRADFLQPITVWRSWVYLAKDIEWKQETQKCSTPSDERRSTANVGSDSDYHFSSSFVSSETSTYHSGPTPTFMWAKLTDAGTALLAQAVLGRRACQTENRRGERRARGWTAKGPGYARQLPVYGKKWMTILEDTWLDEWGGIVKLWDMEHNMLIRCKYCDLTQKGDPLGSCSAHVVKKNGSQGVWCWSCYCMFWEYHETERLAPSWPPSSVCGLRNGGGRSIYLGGEIVDAKKPEHQVNGRPRCTNMIPVDILFECRVTC